MVSESQSSNKAINVFSPSTSFSSRLSPLARPFTINNNHPLSPSTSSLDQPFSYLSLGGQTHTSRGYYAHHSDATSIAAFPSVDDPDFEPNSPSAHYHLEEPLILTHFTLPAHHSSQTSFTPSSSSLGNVGHRGGVPGPVVDRQRRDFLGNAASFSCNYMLEQGTTEGPKDSIGTSSVLAGKDSVVLEKDDRIIPENKEKMHTESNIFPLASSEVNLPKKCMTKPFSTSSDLSLFNRPQDTRKQKPHSASLVTSSHFGSRLIPTEKCFPHLGSCGAKTPVSHAPECFSYSAQNFKPSGGSSNPSIVNAAPLENVASNGIDAVRDSYFGYDLPSTMGTYIVQNIVDKAACSDQVISEKVEKRKIAETAKGTKNASIREKSKLRIACPNVPENLTLEQNGAKAGIPDDKSSSDHGDSDVDSPCWKGTQAYKSPFRDSVPVHSQGVKGQSLCRVSAPLKSEHSENEMVSRNSLNPLAPMFIPGNSKQKGDRHQKGCHHGNSSSSSQKIAALAVTSSSSEQRLTHSVNAGTCPSERDRTNAIGIQCSNDARETEKENGIPYKSFRKSAANSSCTFQTYPREEGAKSQSQLVRGHNVASSTGDTMDTTQNGLACVEHAANNGPNTSFSFPTTDLALNSHSTRVGVFSGFTDRLQDPSKSTPPKIDVKLIINTVQYLLELLLENSSFDIGPLSEHEHDKLLNIISNLYFVIRYKANQMSLRPESSHSCTLYGHRQLADDNEVTELKNKADSDDQEMYKTSALTLSRRMLYSFYQSNDEGFNKEKGTDRVVETDPNVIHSIEKEMPPEALFYRNLWFEAKAALYQMRYQAQALDMKSVPDNADQNRGYFL